MTDTLSLLRDADPAARRPDPPLPLDLMERIRATPPPPPRRRRPRRLVLVPVAVAALAVAVVVLVPADRADLAARAYAATAPDEGVLFTELLEEYAPPDGTTERRVTQIWQRGDRMHRVQTATGSDGRQRIFEWVLDERGLHSKMPEPPVDTIPRDGDAQDREILDHWERTFVDEFRARYADAQLRDAGPATFEGRPAHAYDVLGIRDVRETYFIDPETALPMGYRAAYPWYDRDHPGRLIGHERVTLVVRRIERLPATPDNLARLTAQWVQR
jgi:hypothetical protein